MAQTLNYHLIETSVSEIKTAEGEMAERIRTFDWSKTILGPRAQWSQSLNTAVNIVIHSPAPLIILWGEEASMIYNDAYAAFAGARHPECLGQNCIEVWPEAADFIRNVVSKGLEGESLSYKNLPYTVYRNNKPEEIWMDLDSSPILDDEGIPAGVLIVNVETTDRKKTEWALLESEERLNLALEGTQEGIWDWDFKNDKAWWDERYNEVMGFYIPEADRSLNVINEYIHPEDRHIIPDALKALLESGKKYEVEFRVIRPSGEIRHIYVRGKAVLDEQGAIARLTGTVRDVTKRKLTEQALRESEERYALVFEASNDGIWDYDVLTQGSFWNNRFYEIIGYRREEIEEPGLEFLKAHMHPEDKARVLDEFNNVINHGGFYDIEYRLRHKDGYYINIHSKGIPVKDKSGKIIRIAGITTDITARKKAEEENQRLISILEASCDYVGLASLDGKCIYLNPAAKRIVGWDNYEGRTIIENIYPEDRPLAENTLLPKLLKEGHFSHEIRFLNEKTGEPVWITWNGITIKDPLTGEIKALATISPDITKRKEAEQQIKESEHRYRTLTEEAPVATCLYTGRELRVQYINDVMLGYWGKDRSVIGKPIKEALPEIVGQPFIGYLENVFITGESYFGREEKADLMIDGKLKSGYFNFSYKALRNNKNEIYGIHHMAVDVTEEVLAKQALQESEQRFQAAIAAMQGVLWTNNSKGEMEGPQPGWEKLTGQSYEEYHGYGWSKVVHPEDAQTTVEAWNEAVKERKTFVFEHRLKRKDGTWGNFSIRAIPLINADGTIREWVGVHTDITEQSQAEQTLKESEERFRALADQAPMFVFIVEPDAQASMSYFNKTWLEYAGITYEQGLGTSWVNVIHPEDLPVIRALYEPAFYERRAYTLPAIRVKKYTGEYRWHLFKGNPRFLSNGEFIGYVGVGIDIHEQKIIHEQLESKNDQLIKINNDLDNFIYTASHDLKAPMSNIEGLLISLRENLESEVEKVNEEADILLQLMEKSINRFKTTILDLTEITKVQKAQEEDIKEINFAQIVEDVKLSIYDKIVESGVNIETNFSAVNSVKFSKKNLKSIIYNLLSNGIKYRDTRKSPEVFIKTEKIENYIVMMIRDNGLGINEQNQGKMFTMFKRFHDHVEGTGVGLYIVKRIVDNAGGKIEVESEVGKGTTFKVYFKSS